MSTLVNYLTKSHRTLRHLAQNGDNYFVVSFFFDFRAGTSAANNLTGPFKMFLSQLNSSSRLVEVELMFVNDQTSLRDVSVTRLMDAFRDAIRRLPTRICAFVDGLDEYRGDFTALLNTLSRIQDRTEIKSCLVSRPEPALIEQFRDFPQICMQDHNASSVRVYVDQAVKKGRLGLIEVDPVFDNQMRNEIQQRAQGVIIWARLAVDDLLRAASNMPTKESLQDVLNQLPNGLE